MTRACHRSSSTGSYMSLRWPSLSLLSPYVCPVAATVLVDSLTLCICSGSIPRHDKAQLHHLQAAVDGLHFVPRCLYHLASTQTIIQSIFMDTAASSAFIAFICIERLFRIIPPIRTWTLVSLLQYIRLCVVDGHIVCNISYICMLWPASKNARIEPEEQFKSNSTLQRSRRLPLHQLATQCRPPPHWASYMCPFSSLGCSLQVRTLV